MHLNGTVKFLVPIGAIVTLIVGLHVLQQGDVGEVRAVSAKNTTDIAREGALRGAQFDEIMRALERIEKELE
jgi:hypothetical protein